MMRCTTECGSARLHAMRIAHQVFLAFVAVVLLLLSCFASEAQTLYQDGKLASELYGDLTARKVGDLVTVVILQNARANQQAQSARDRSSSLDASANLSYEPRIEGTAQFSGRTRRSGTRSTTRQTNFVATVTARVVEDLGNGNLRVEGTQSTAIDDQETNITVSGIIRRTDIQPDNTVLSSALAEAKIEYREPTKPKSVQDKIVGVVTYPFRLAGAILGTLF